MFTICSLYIYYIFTIYSLYTIYALLYFQGKIGTISPDFPGEIAAFSSFDPHVSLVSP